MAYPPEFKFDDEADFIRKLIVPLLQRMGFSMISGYHGASEYGKDVVFADVDQFGHVRFHAVQAKYVASLDNRGVLDLVDQTKMAFASAFTHPNTGQTERINTFYAINGGSISEQARKNYFDGVPADHLGHVRLLDGSAILHLDRMTAVTRTADLRERLHGILVEVLFNQRLLHEMLPKLKVISETKPDEVGKDGKPVDIYLDRLTTYSVSDYLSRPVMSNKVDIDAIILYRHRAELFNESLRSMGAPMKKGIAMHKDSVIAMKVALELEGFAIRIAKSIKTILEKLGPLTSL